MCSLELTADCARCCALCCVVYAFARSPEFAVDKPARVACGYVTTGFQCSIHHERIGRGYPGCVTYDCHGAGQFVTQALFAGRAWTELTDPAEMLDVFLIVRELFEQLALLRTALSLDLPEGVRSGLHTRDARLRELIQRPRPLAELRAIDVEGERAATDSVLRGLAPHVDRHAIARGGVGCGCGDGCGDQPAARVARLRDMR